MEEADRRENYQDDLVDAMERKYILGVLHVKVICQGCKGQVWTQDNTVSHWYLNYRCHTCQDPQRLGVGREHKGIGGGVSVNMG
jgi:hypothetical protein